jgi:hypothetical protein
MAQLMSLGMVKASVWGLGSASRGAEWAGNWRPCGRGKCLGVFSQPLADLNAYR